MFSPLLCVCVYWFACLYFCLLLCVCLFAYVFACLLACLFSYLLDSLVLTLLVLRLLACFFVHMIACSRACLSLACLSVWLVVCVGRFCFAYVSVSFCGFVCVCVFVDVTCVRSLESVCLLFIFLFDRECFWIFLLAPLLVSPLDSVCCLLVC